MLMLENASRSYRCTCLAHACTAFSLFTHRSSRLQLSLASVHPRSGRSTLENVLRSSLLFISDERSVYTLFKKNRADPFHSFTTIAQKADLNHTSIKINVCTGPQGEDDGEDVGGGRGRGLWRRRQGRGRRLLRFTRYTTRMIRESRCPKGY